MHYINLKTRGGEIITLAEAPSRVEAEKLARQYRALYKQKKYRICVSRRATRTHYEEYGTLQERGNGSQLIESDLSGCLFWLVALLLALLVAEPVMAVDYVKCDAIQRAYGRLATQRDKDWGNAKASKIMELCPTSRLPWNPAPNVNNKQEMDAFMANVEEIGRQNKIWQACMSESGNIAIAKAFAEKEVSSLDKRIVKVKADYFAAKCP